VDVDSDGQTISPIANQPPGLKQVQVAMLARNRGSGTFVWEPWNVPGDPTDHPDGVTPRELGSIAAGSTGVTENPALPSFK